MQTSRALPTSGKPCLTTPEHPHKEKKRCSGSGHWLPGGTLLFHDCPTSAVKSRDTPQQPVTRPCPSIPSYHSPIPRFPSEDKDRTTSEAWYGRYGRYRRGEGWKEGRRKEGRRVGSGPYFPSPTSKELSFLNSFLTPSQTPSTPSLMSRPCCPACPTHSLGGLSVSGGT